MILKEKKYLSNLSYKLVLEGEFVKKYPQKRGEEFLWFCSNNGIEKMWFFLEGNFQGLPGVGVKRGKPRFNPAGVETPADPAGVVTPG